MRERLRLPSTMLPQLDHDETLQSVQPDSSDVEGQGGAPSDGGVRIDLDRLRGTSLPRQADHSFQGLILQMLQGRFSNLFASHSLPPPCLGTATLRSRVNMPSRHPESAHPDHSVSSQCLQLRVCGPGHAAPPEDCAFSTDGDRVSFAPSHADQAPHEYWQSVAAPRDVSTLKLLPQQHLSQKKSLSSYSRFFANPSVSRLTPFGVGP